MGIAKNSTVPRLDTWVGRGKKKKGVSNNKKDDLLQMGVLNSCPHGRDEIKAHTGNGEKSMGGNKGDNVGLRSPPAKTPWVEDRGKKTAHDDLRKETKGFDQTKKKQKSLKNQREGLRSSKGENLLKRAPQQQD